MINIRRVAAKSAMLLVITAGLMLSIAACMPAPQVKPALPQNQPPAPTLSSQAPALSTEPKPVEGQSDSEVNVSDNTSQPPSGPSVEIILIHHRGTLTRIGCCNPMLYERDEFVVIQNKGDEPQDITDWSLSNVTRGYPTFRFPSHFPCLPYNPPVLEADSGSGSTYSIVQNPAQSVIDSLSISNDTTKPVNQPASEVNWAACNPVEPLDETPMKPAEGQQGIPVPSVLYPGQTILVFTDEVHCSSGGFSFNWGQGNIWSNDTADTAVLYDSRGAEVSRRSYTVGR